MSKSHRVAIVGATGAVGRKFIECLEKRRFPVGSLEMYASPHSVGKVQHFGGKPRRQVKPPTQRGAITAVRRIPCNTPR